MANQSLQMDQIERVIELYEQGVAKKQIARILGLSRTTVKKYISRIESAGGVNGLSQDNIKTVVYDGGQIDQRNEVLISELDGIIKELKRAGVTRQLLWEEYKKRHPGGFSYGRFCDRIREYKRAQNSTIKLIHEPGNRLQVDFTGKKVKWINRKTGEEIWCDVLVCTMAYSSYTFACAVASQKQPDFTEAINRALIYLNGVPKILLSDNLSSYVKKANRYEPIFTDFCIQFASHYGLELQATRVAKPKDKANVERHVAIVYNRLYAPLRDREFYSLEEINEAFLELLDDHNSKNFQGKEYSRKDLFVRDEQPVLRELPKTLFEYTKHTQAKVQKNYHIILGEDRHQYSVPYQYIGKTTQVNYTSKIVEIFIGIDRIAFHKRDLRKHSYTTVADHMPEKHKKYIEQRGWDARYFCAQAQKIGPNALQIMEKILDSKQFVEQAYNTCLGMLSLERKYTALRLEKACKMVCQTHRLNYQSVKLILNKGLDQVVDKTEEQKSFRTLNHENTRGATNYQ